MKRAMSKMHYSISLITGGLLGFIILCSPLLRVPFGILLFCLLLLQGGLIWIVITILKNGQCSTHTFDEKFYDDADLGPRRL
jgi:hypothetical protein